MRKEASTLTNPSSSSKILFPTSPTPHNPSTNDHLHKPNSSHSSPKHPSPHTKVVNPTSATNVPKINLFDTHSLTIPFLSLTHKTFHQTPPLTNQSIPTYLSRISVRFIFSAIIATCVKKPFFKDGDLGKPTTTTSLKSYQCQPVVSLLKLPHTSPLRPPKRQPKRAPSIVRRTVVASYIKIKIKKAVRYTVQRFARGRGWDGLLARWKEAGSGFRVGL